MSSKTCALADHISKIPDAGTVFHIKICNGPGPHNNHNMLLCNLDEFLSSYGPCQNVTKDDVDSLFAKMVSDGLLVDYQGGGYIWSGCDQDSSSDCGVGSAAASKPLKLVVDYVLKDGWEKVQEKASMGMIPMANIQFTEDVPGSGNKSDVFYIGAPYVDGRFLSRDLDEKINVETRTTTSREIIHLQILGACRYIMDEDARRMWIYGLTFENDLCSVWYFSRSHSVKTVAFNWITNPKTFVRVLLAFAKATSLELGIDPTIHLVPIDAGAPSSFVYEIPAADSSQCRFFRTVESVYTPHSMAIAGRATRVYKVVEVSSSSGENIINHKEVILKDVWFDDGGKTEAENMDAIFAAVDKFVDAGLEAILQDDASATRESLLSSPDTMKQIIERDPRFKTFDQVSKDHLCSNLTDKAYRSLFLTKLHAWQGEVCKPIAKEVWRCPTLFSSYPISYLESEESILLAEHGARQCTAENLTLPRVDSKKRAAWEVQQSEQYYRTFVSKRQSRVIYEEVCTTLQDLDTLGEVIDVLCQTMDTMHILFLAGWVHHDISANNIMACRSSPNEQWAVKLADLEFSRLMVDPSRNASGDPRIGTPFFMPVEILDREHLLYRHAIPSHELVAEDHEEPVAEDPDVAFLNLFRQPFATVADQVNASKLGPEFHETLKHFTALPFIITIPPNPCWKEVSLQSIPVNHNYQHDLESIWWIILWITLCRIQFEENFIPSQQVLQYFDHDVRKFHARVSLITHNLNELRPYFHQDLYKPLFNTLEGLRRSMHAAYVTRALFGHLGLAESYTGIQVLFARVLRATRAMPGSWTDMKLMKRPGAVLGENSFPALASHTPGPSAERQLQSSEDQSSEDSEDQSSGDSEYQSSEDSDDEDKEGEEEEARPKKRRRIN